MQIKVWFLYIFCLLNDVADGRGYGAYRTSGGSFGLSPVVHIFLT